MVEKESDYAGYDPDDEEFFGARAVVEAEYAAIWKRRGEAGRTGRPDNMVGLALSGGGIRSASFNLGVLQALAFAGWLKNVDYLSTVSGGGYIGASLTWLLHKEWPTTTVRAHDAHRERQAEKTVRFGVNEENFPYGLYPVPGGSKASETHAYSYRGRLLRYLRQNARYLTPGHGIGPLALGAVILRNSLYSFAVYGALLVLSFALLGPWAYAEVPSGGWAPWPAHSWVVNALIVVAALFALSVPVYSFWTALAHRKGVARQYLKRRRYEVLGGRAIGVVLALAVVSLLPVVHQWMEPLVPLADGRTVEQPVARAPAAPAGEVKKPAPDVQRKDAPSGLAPLTTGSLSALLGVISSVLAFFRAQSGSRNQVPTSLLVAFGTTALVFGLLLLSYDVYTRWFVPLAYGSWAYSASSMALLLGFVLLGRFVNTNYMSIHRFYRDRLMETFMPNVPDVLQIDGVPVGVAHEADSKPLHQLWPPTDGRPPGPYPIINAQAVLVSSNIPKFRGRGGDNFVLTPDFCGSNATGWRRTKTFYHWMTLASAMAISGAAVNPSTGVGGQGLTRQPMLSFLMGLLNIRLGYWVLNPMPRALRIRRLVGQRQSEWLAALKMRVAEVVSPVVPNALWPGVSELFLRRNLEENSHMLQLTDGGHFENLGLYELVRRKLPLIIACDASADPDYTFGDLANAIEKVRADFGVLVSIDASALQPLAPGPDADKDAANQTSRYSTRGYLVGRIAYPNAQGGTTSGTLIYLTTTFFKALSADLYGYRKVNPAFPDESTTNQFFDERQFDAYRELGYQTALGMMTDSAVRWSEHVGAVMGHPPWQRQADPSR